MKAKIHFLPVLIAALLLPAFLSAQNFATKQNNNPTKPIWVAVKLSADGSNALNKVSFFSQKSQCTGQESVLLRMVNGNSFQVKVQWQSSAESPVMEVLVEPFTDLMGACPSVNDKKPSGLVMNNNYKTEEEKQTARKYFLAHLTVTQVK